MLTASEVRACAREKMQGRWGFGVATIMFYVLAPSLFLLALTLVIFAIALGATAINGGQISTAVNVIIQIVGFVGDIGMMALTALLFVGVYWAFLKVARGETTATGEIFAPLRPIYWRGVWAYILWCLYLTLWTLLLIFPGIIKGMAYAQTFFILRDHPELTANQAITRSRQMMDGHKWELFCLMFSFIGWWLLCLVTLGLATLWIIPYAFTAFAIFYDEIRGEKITAAGAPISLDKPLTAAAFAQPDPFATVDASPSPITPVTPTAGTPPPLPQ